MPLDDCLYALPGHYPALDPLISPSLSYKCHGISRLRSGRRQDQPKRPLKRYPIGYFDIEIAEVRTEEGNSISLWPWTGHPNSPSLNSTTRLEIGGGAVPARPDDAVPYKIHTVLTDNGIQFVNRKRDTNALEHIFQRTCREFSIEHRLTKINHPWTNGQVERMN